MNPIVGKRNKLPVPPLHSSLEKYLRSLRHFLDDGLYNKTKQVVERFEKGVGLQLYNILKEKAEIVDNWVEEYWIKYWFLESRNTLIFESNTALVCPERKFSCVEDQLKFASCFISAVLKFKMLVDKEKLKPDMARGEPLDMSQYSKIFSSCRIPKIECDEWIDYSKYSDPPKHIIVIHNNHFFKVDVVSENGAFLSENQIMWQLQKVVELSQNPEIPIGFLTTQNRDIWAEIYTNLQQHHKTNKQSVVEIERAIFAVCLDKQDREDIRFDKTHCASNCVYGGSLNCGNRWFDKTIQLIVSANGIVGLNFEHTPADGTIYARLMDDSIEYIETILNENVIPSSVGAKSPEKIRFILDNNLLRDIKEAEAVLKKDIENRDFECFTYSRYGKDFIKSQNLSPDGFIQMALQLAYYSLFGTIVGTYEAAHTRKFLKGRTEKICSAMKEASEFCIMMKKDCCSQMRKTSTLRDAVNAHKQLSLEAVNGMGTDRLLLGLQDLATETGLDASEFFQNFGVMAKSKMITSQVQMKTDSFMCIFNSSLNNYATCYNPMDLSIVFSISTLKSSPKTAADFKFSLIQSLDEMQHILLKV